MASELSFNVSEVSLSELSMESFKSRMPVVIYLVILIVAGLFGNSLVLVVYLLRFRPSATRSFILGMAACDLLTSVVGLPLQLATIYYAYDTYSLLFCRGMFAAATLPTQSSGVLLNVVAYDRYRRICWPHRAQLSPRKATTVVIIFIVGTCVAFTSFVPMYGIHTIEKHGVNLSMCWSDDSFKKTIYPKAYSTFVSVVFYIGISIMIFAYSNIALRLWQQARARRAQAASITVVKTVTPHEDDTFSKIQKMSQNVKSVVFNPVLQMRSASNTEDFRSHHRSTRSEACKFNKRATKTTMMMTILTICYVLNWLPHLIVRELYSHPVNWCDEFTQCGSNTYALALRSYYGNSAINVVVYSFFSHHFRDQCRILLGIPGASTSGVLESDVSKSAVEGTRVSGFSVSNVTSYLPKLPWRASRKGGRSPAISEDASSERTVGTTTTKLPDSKTNGSEATGSCLALKAIKFGRYLSPNIVS